MVEIALGFMAVETRSFTLNIHVPSSGFWYHVLATALGCVAVWTGWGLSVALLLIISQFATGIMNVMWLFSRSDWLGFGHILFFVLYVPVFVLFRAFCYIASARLAWSLMLNAVTLETIAPWSAYVLMIVLIAFFMCHAVWSCEMVLGAIIDVTSYSSLVGRGKRSGKGGVAIGSMGSPKEVPSSNDSSSLMVSLIADRDRTPTEPQSDETIVGLPSDAEHSINADERDGRMKKQQ